MPDSDTTERTAGGFAGKLAGKAKQAAGSVLGDETLAREGRLQEASVDAEVQSLRDAKEAEQSEQEAAVTEEKAQLEAERARLQAEAAEAEREQAIDRDRKAAEQAAERERLQTAQKDAHLEQHARHAEATADLIDPEETR